MKTQTERDDQTVVIIGYLAIAAVLACVAMVAVEVFGPAVGLVSVFLSAGAVLVLRRR